MRKAWQAVCFLLLFAATAFAQQDFLSRLQGECLGNFLADQPPLIEKVEAGEAKADAEIPVEAVIHNDEELTDDVVTAATLHYSVDEGKTWETVAFEPKDPDAETPKEWKAAIPAQPAGTKVLFYASAVDTSNNVSTEVPGKVTHWPPTSPEDEATMLPAGLPDENCEKMQEAGLDILQLAYGYDDAKIYGKMKVRGKFEGGTPSPPHINLYFTGILPPQLGVMDLVNMFSQGFGGGGANVNFTGALYVYAPLVKDIGGSAIGVTKNHAVLNSQSVRNVPNVFLSYDEAESTDDGTGTDTLYFSFARKAADAKQDVWKAAAGALFIRCDITALLGGGKASGNDFLNCLGTDFDLALFLNTYLRTHEVTVQ